MPFSGAHLPIAKIGPASKRSFRPFASTSPGKKDKTYVQTLHCQFLIITPKKKKGLSRCSLPAAFAITQPSVFCWPNNKRVDGAAPVHPASNHNQWWRWWSRSWRQCWRWWLAKLPITLYRCRFAFFGWPWQSGTHFLAHLHQGLSASADRRMGVCVCVRTCVWSVI